jgi:predicted nucleic acid-binding protein
LTSAASIERAIDAGSIVLLDTSVILAYLSGAEPSSAAATHLLDQLVASGRNPAVVSAITVTETLVRPMRAGSAPGVRLVEDFLLRFPNLRIVPVSVEVAREGARIRAATALRAPDALILATGVGAGASTAVAEDRSWTNAAKRAGLDLSVLHLV